MSLEERREYYSGYRQKNRQQITATAQAWRQRNPEPMRAYHQRQHAKDATVVMALRMLGIQIRRQDHELAYAVFAQLGVEIKKKRKTPDTDAKRAREARIAAAARELVAKVHALWLAEQRQHERDHEQCGRVR